MVFRQIELNTPVYLNNIMFTQTELQSNAVVCSERGLRDAPLGQVKHLERMTRLNATWQGKPVACIYFPDPKNAWDNQPATRVAGRPIRGNAVLLGVTAAELSVQQNTPKSWAGLAKELPKTVPLDAHSIGMKMQAQAEQAEAWRDHLRRKAARNRKINLRTATIDLVTGKVVTEDGDDYEDDEMRAAFAEWEEQDAAGR